MQFDRLLLYRIIGSTAAVVLGGVLSSLLTTKARHTQKQFNLRKSRYFAVRRGINLVSLLMVIVAQILIWGVDIRNLWVSLTGLLALVAIAFVAVWSLVGNILAGFLLYFTAPFRVDDYIEVLPEKVRGQVLAINTFFTVLHDDDGHYVNVPNTMLFQKFVVNYRRNPVSQQPLQQNTEAQTG